MKKQDIRNIIITFALGILVGAYLYVYGFMPQYSVVTDWTEGVGELAVVVREYGACTATADCINYRVAPDGSYRLILPSGESGVASEVYNGEISEEINKKLHQTFTATALPLLAQPVAPTNCDSSNGGFDYQLEITLSNKTFSLDTCTTALAHNLAALAALEALQNEI